MRRSYNQSDARRGRGAQQSAAFWEVALDPSVCAQLPEERRLWYESSEEAIDRLERRERLPQLLADVLAIVDTALTPRQREVVRRYFLEGQTEAQIAHDLGISAPSVSQHLFGKRRGGRSVGGAIARIRKEMARREGRGPCELRAQARSPSIRNGRSLR